MDTPAWAQPQMPAPAPFTPQPRRSRKLLMTALVLGLIASLISAYFIWRDWSSTGLPLLSGAQDVLLEPQAPPLFPAAVLNTGSLKLTPLTVEGQGTASLLSYAHGKDKNYYILTTNGKSSNVYVSDTKNIKAGLSQRTASQTLKVSLSYDASSDLLAFATVSGSSSMITLLRSGTTTEQMLARGINPVLLKGGSYIMYEQAGKLYSLNTSDGTNREVLTIPSKGAYAIDPDALRAVIYSPVTQSFQFYSLVNFESASAESGPSAANVSGVHKLGLRGKQIIDLTFFPQGLALPLKSKYSNVTAIPNSGPYKDAMIIPYDH